MMKMLHSAWNWVDGCRRSGVAWALLTLHAVWFFAAINAMGRPSRAAALFRDNFSGADWVIIAGRPFHFTYEPSIMKALVIGDLPANIVCAFFDICISPVWRVLHVGTYYGSYIGAGEWLLGGSLQWFLIGGMLELSWRRIQHP